MGDNATYSTQVLFVHKYEHVVVGIVSASYLTRYMPCVAYAVRLKGAQCHWIYGVANLLTACGGRINFQQMSYANFLSHVSHHEFGCHTAADITMADK